MNYLQLVNAVMVKLREEQVTSVADSEYSLLIGSFVNQAKNQVERKRNWSMLRQAVSLDTVVDQSEAYSLAGIGKQSQELLVVDLLNQNKLKKVSSIWLARQRAITPNETGQPLYYSWRGLDSNGDLTLDIWPKPDAVYSLYFEFKIPQDELSVDTTNLFVPDYPVLLRAWELGVRERGEDDGISWQEIREDFKEALADEIALDESREPGETCWEVE